MDAGGGAADGTISIEVLLLDVGGVLVPPPDLEQVAAVEQQLALPSGGLYALLYECDAWRALSTGALQEDAYWQSLAAGADRDPASLRALAYPLWGPICAQAANAEVIALVRAARTRVRTAILSNATLGLEDGLRAYGVADLFDPIINSARAGLRKPDPEMFRYALSLLAAPPGAVLFVDDKPRNTRVARELGIPCVDFTGAASLAAALQQYGIVPDALAAS